MEAILCHRCLPHSSWWANGRNCEISVPQGKAVPLVFIKCPLPNFRKHFPRREFTDTAGAPAELRNVIRTTGMDAKPAFSSLNTEGPLEVPPPRATLQVASEGPSPAEIRELHRLHSEICGYSLHFNIFKASLDREKVTQPGRDIVPFNAGSGGVPKRHSHLRGSHAVCPAVNTVLEEDRVNVSFFLDLQPFPGTSRARLQQCRAPHRARVCRVFALPGWRVFPLG